MHIGNIILSFEVLDMVSYDIIGLVSELIMVGIEG